ncbi:hypothetical protein M406DRAFT_322868 [Cryphonectria parasitica EP155]|uniref:Uncharacterized protein n=1 Tax=Cryphonectria parasitica (strain ATCC 38755 / EP155) TaxID=660469 RepID=A0A9P4Y1R8_CRYP1|nr:uncharacterized protein M406DRAFT_322868 [Cryphonectria parasitica EP155]KAF3765073.1 hypothetical protein M406DRAFT_322868 [Cryphonectria parasitica EP155]
MRRLASGSALAVLDSVAQSLSKVMCAYRLVVVPVAEQKVSCLPGPGVNYSRCDMSMS